MYRLWLLQTTKSLRRVNIHATYDHLHLCIQKTLIRVDIIDNYQISNVARVGTGGTSTRVQ
jgi:hypothetical protein